MKELSVGYSLDLNVTSSALANGSDENTATATLSKNTSLVSGENIIFNVDKSAKFTNGLNTFAATTNVLGVATVMFTDTVAESVTITASMNSDSSVFSTAASAFNGSSVGQADKITLDLITDDALADGSDMNMVAIGTRSGSDTAPATLVEVSLSNGATFINGVSSTSITTNDLGNASLPFMNTVPGSVRVSAYLPDNIAVYQTIDSNFVSTEPDIESRISLMIDVDNVIANGQALNRVTALVSNSINGEPLANIAVNFSVTGDAKFSLNELQSYQGVTDTFGKCQVSLHDAISEDVIVTAILVAEPSKNSSVGLHFAQSYSELAITKVFNVNQNFVQNEPTIAFSGSRIFMDSVGGSGNVTWTLDSTNSGVRLGNENNNSAYIDILSKPYYEFSVTVTDNVTGETLSRHFKINTFFDRYGEVRTIHGINLEGESKYLPSKTQLNELYQQWGDMTHYANWLAAGEKWCWTDKFNLLGLKCEIFNLTNGTTKDIFDTFAVKNFVGVKID